MVYLISTEQLFFALHTFFLPKMVIFRQDKLFERLLKPEKIYFPHEIFNALKKLKKEKIALIRTEGWARSIFFQGLFCDSRTLNEARRKNIKNIKKIEKKN